MQPNQAANELTEEQVLNFLVNTLDEEIDLSDIPAVSINSKIFRQTARIP